MFKKYLKEAIIVVCIAAPIFIALQFVIQQFVVNQVSMFPNLAEGQRVLINKVSYSFHNPERGDIIVFKPSPSAFPGETPLIKRVIGLPGETVEIHSGAVFINGSALKETDINNPPAYTMGPMVIPEGHYFVLGDNRNASRDSHFGWTVPGDSIIGKAWLSTWPPSKWGVISSPAYASR